MKELEARLKRGSHEIAAMIACGPARRCESLLSLLMASKEALGSTHNFATLARWASVGWRS